MIVSNKALFYLDKTRDSLKFDTENVDVDRSKYGSHFIKSSMLQITANSKQTTEIKFENSGAFHDYYGDCYAINKPCQTCGRIYYDLPMMGIPIQIRNTDDGKIIIDGDGEFHSFECTYIALRRVYDSVMNSRSINPIYQRSDYLFNWLFKICYPDDVLDTTTIVSNFKHYKKATTPNILLMPLKTSESTKKELNAAGNNRIRD